MPGLTVTNPKEIYVANRMQNCSPEIARRQTEHMCQIRDEQYLDELLDGAEEEFQAELARRKEEAEAPPEPEAEPLTLDMRKANLRQEIKVLTERRRRLSRLALTDEGACLEMSNVEAATEAKEAEIERIILAEAEIERMAPIEAAEEEKRRKAQAAAERLAAKEAARATSFAEAVDKAGEAFAIAVKEHHAHNRRKRELLEEAGILKSPPFGFVAHDWSYESALCSACCKHDVGGVIRRSDGHPPARPLAEPKES
jgi:hypothetical protein